MNTSTTCCNLLNTFDPAAPGVCDSIKMLYTAGDQVQDLNDVLNIVDLFTDTLRVDDFTEVVNTINANIDLLSLFCPGASSIGYCLEPVDFTQNAYEIGVGGDCPPLEDRTGTETSGVINAVVIQSVATVPPLTNTEYIASNCIFLDAGFCVELNVSFSAEIGPCPLQVATADPQQKEEAPQDKKK